MSAMSATSTTELEEVMALLERILPDPAGYGQRLIQQVVLQWAETGQHQPTIVPGETRKTSGTGNRGRSSLADLVLHPDDPGSPPATPIHDDPQAHPAEDESGPADIRTLLACALGACDCWGTRTDCVICAGAGSPGWADPDPDLFQKYVGPAAARLTVILHQTPGDEAGQPSEPNTESRQGVKP